MSGLTDGASEAQFVRASAAGRCERVATASINSATDDLIGYAEKDGRVHLFVGLPYAELVQIVDVIGDPFTPGGTDTQVYYNNAGALATTSQATVAGGRLTLVSPIVTGVPVYQGTRVSIPSTVTEVQTASTSQVTCGTYALTDEHTVALDVIVRCQRRTSNTKRGRWKFSAVVSRNGAGAVLDVLDVGDAFNLTAGTVTCDVSGNSFRVLVTPTDSDSRNWDSEIRAQDGTAA